MKTFNHKVSFPSAVGELIVQYNFTEAELNWSGRDKPAEVEITGIYFTLKDGDLYPYRFSDDDILKEEKVLKQAVYTEHMKKLKEEEDAEWKDWDEATMADWNKANEEEDDNSQSTEGLGEPQPEYLDDLPEFKSCGIYTQYPPEQYEA